MRKKLKKLIIIGGGQFGILVSKIVQKSKEFNIIGFIDNDEKKFGKKINNIKVLGNDKKLKKFQKKKICVAIAIGDIKKRKLLIKKLSNNFIFPKIIADTCKIDESVKIGKGTIITNHSIILNHTKIGKFCLIGSANKILHNVSISNNCLVGGGSVIGSNVKIKPNVYIGVGAIFASKKITIGNDVYVCSASGVFGNIKSHSKVIGNPARSIPFFRK